MKTLYIILALFLFGAASAHSQTLKTLSYNTTNGQVVYSGSNSLTFTDALQFSTNARAATRTNLGGTTVGNSVFTATNAAEAATAVGLGTTNDVTFNRVVTTSLGSTTNPAIRIGPSNTGFYSPTNGYLYLLVNDNFVIGASDDSINFSKSSYFYDTITVYQHAEVRGNLVVSNTATFATNVTVNGTLIIASPTVPTSPTNSGTAGQIAYTNNYLYICISNNTWRRAQLGTW